MVRTQIQLTEDQAKRARERAGTLGISISELIRRALDETLAERSDKDEVRRRALSVIGCVTSDVGDLSVNHDKYLVEAYSR